MACEIGGSGMDEQPADVWDEVWRTATENFECAECNRGIAKGEKYESHFYYFDGRAETFKMCKECSEIVFKCMDGYTHGVLWDDVAEYIYNENGCYMDISGLSESNKWLIIDMMQSCMDEREDDE